MEMIERNMADDVIKERKKWEDEARKINSESIDEAFLYLQKCKEAAKDMGMIFDEETTKKIENFEHQITTLNQKLEIEIDVCADKVKHVKRTMDSHSALFTRSPDDCQVADVAGAPPVSLFAMPFRALAAAAAGAAAACCKLGAACKAHNLEPALGAALLQRASPTGWGGGTTMPRHCA